MSDLESKTAQQKVNFPQRILQVVGSSQGFTLFELIMIIILIAILSVSVVPKFVDTSAISLQGGAAMIVADIRYTQELAMSTHAPKTITFSTNDTFYTVVSQTVDLPSKVSVSSGATFTFNSLGEPTTGGSVQIQAGSTTKTITVESYTGKVSSS